MIKNLILLALRRKTKKKKKTSNDVLGNFPSPSLCLVKFFQKAEGKRMFSFHSKCRKKKKADFRSEFDLLVSHGHPCLFSLEIRKSRD